MILVHIDPDTSRDDLLEALAHYNTRAKQLSRRGMTATLTDHYRDLHDTINALSEAIETFDKAAT